MTNEQFYGRVAALGLKSTAVPTVYQTLDEQERFNVPHPDSFVDDVEREVFLEWLAMMVPKGGG